MANADIREFQFYFKYLFDQNNTGDNGDFQQFQRWLCDRFEGVFEGFFGPGPLRGMRVLPDGGMGVVVGAGIGVTQYGRIVVLANDVALPNSIGTDPANPRRALVVVRSSLVAMTAIAQPLPTPPNPAGPWLLHRKLTNVAQTLQGVAGVTPAYPANDVNDVILGGFLVPPATTVLTEAMFDNSVRHAPKKTQVNLKTITPAGNPNLLGTGDEYVEADCTTGDVIAVLPDRFTVKARRPIQIVRIDTNAAAKARVQRSGADQFNFDAGSDYETAIEYQMPDVLQGAKFFSGSLKWNIER